MRRLVAVVAGLLVVGLAGSALAQNGEEATDDGPREQFVEMEGLNIDGERDAPSIVTVRPDNSGDFEPLLELKRKSFMKEVDESAEDGAL